MSAHTKELERALVIAGSLVTRGDGRRFCRTSPTGSVREISERTAHALALAVKAAPHLQRHVLLRRAERQSPSALITRACREALEALPVALRLEYDHLRHSMAQEPVSEPEQELLLAAAFLD